MKNEELRWRWEAHLASPFPPEARGKTIDDVDLVYLDSSTAGAVQTALSGRPDPDLLRSLHAEIKAVQQRLSGEPANYFGRLGDVVEAVLRST